jgi:hypothetical protein
MTVAVTVAMPRKMHSEKADAAWAEAKARAGVESEADFQTYSRPETRGRLCFVIARLGFNVWI